MEYQRCICQISSAGGGDGRSKFWVLTSEPGPCHSWVRLLEGRSQCWSLHPEGSTGEGGVKIDPLNLFTNIRRGRGSHILCKGIGSSWPPLQIQPFWWCAFQSSRRSCFSGGCSSVLELYTAAESELLHQSSRSGGNLKLSCSHSHFLLCNGHYETIY